MSNALKHLTLRTFRPGSIIFREGENTTSFYIIHKGEVEIYIQNPKGSKKTLGIVKPGEPIGEFAFILNSPRSATAETLTSVEAFEISAEGYEQLVSELPDWAQSFIESLIKRLSESTQRLKN